MTGLRSAPLPRPAMAPLVRPAPAVITTRPVGPSTLPTTAPVPDPGEARYLGVTPAFRPEFPGSFRHVGESGGRGAAERQADLVGSHLVGLLGSLPLASGRLFGPAVHALEPVLGVSLADVEFDTGSAGRTRADEDGAQAVTRDGRISFAAAAFRPDTESGRALIGHELTHVAQQRRHRTTVPQRFAAVLDYEKLARQIRNAVDGPGTDEEAIYRALNDLHREPAAVALLESTYQRLFGESLQSALRGDLDDDELDFANGLLGKPVSGTSTQRIDAAAPAGAAGWDAMARRLKAAADYQTWGFLGGTDEEAIFAVLTPLAGDPEKIAQIKAAYTRITRGGPTALVDMLKSELSGSERKLAFDLIDVPDPHAGTQAQLSSADVLAVRNEIAPATRVAPPPATTGAPAAPLPPAPRWDGRTGAPASAANRALLKSQLTADLTKFLARVMPIITPRVSAPKIPIKALEGAANAAVEVTDAEFRSSYAVAAATPGQAAARSGFTFSEAAGNLLDATSPAGRVAMGAPISATSVATWMVQNDAPPTPPGALEHMAAHNFDPDRTGDGEDAWVQSDVIAPFVAPAARRLQLEQFDQFGFGLQPDPGKIGLPTSTPGSSLGTGGKVPNLPDRRRMWSTWHIAVHEYLHNLVHPAFAQATAGPVMKEGFTEFFTKKVLTKAAPVAHLNRGLVTKVEGGIFSPQTDFALVGAYSPPATYAANLAHVEAVAARVPGGENAVRAAYFQGHVEMLGMDPATHKFEAAPPISVDPASVAVPAGISTLADLATRSGVAESKIRTANPGIGAPLPARVRLPGAREHRVAATFTGSAVGPRETDVQIAAQNGVSLAALRAANPSVLWASLTLGQRVLIPKIERRP